MKVEGGAGSSPEGRRLGWALADHACAHVVSERLVYERLPNGERLCLEVVE